MSCCCQYERDLSRVTGFFKIKNLVISGQSGARVYLKDFAQVVDTVAETQSYARLGWKNVITLNVIKNQYEISESYIKMFFHYEPYTYHLHIHFVHINNQECRSSVEYSHELNSVIFNLSICSDYYQTAILNKRN